MIVLGCILAVVCTLIGLIAGYFIGHADGFEEGVLYVVLPDDTDEAGA